MLGTAKRYWFIENWHERKNWLKNNPIKQATQAATTTNNLSNTYSSEEQAEIEEQLRDLGYIE